MGESEFRKGMEVEVCSDDQGLRGAWFVATILRSLPKKKKVFIQYHTLMVEDEDEDEDEPLKEMVDVVNIRPLPPPEESGTSFNVSDEVDAVHNDGWWEGVVIKVLDGCRYLVYFRTGKEEHVFEKSELRVHREWVHGKWVPPVEEEMNASTVEVKNEDLTGQIQTHAQAVLDRYHAEGSSMQEDIVEEAANDNEKVEEEVGNRYTMAEEEHNSAMENKEDEEAVEELSLARTEIVEEVEMNANKVTMEETLEDKAEDLTGQLQTHVQAVVDRRHAEGSSMQDDNVVDVANDNEKVANRNTKAEEEHNLALENKADEEEAVVEFSLARTEIVEEVEMNANKVTMKETLEDKAEDLTGQLQDMDVEHIEIDVRSDQAQLPFVHNTADIASKENTIDETARPCPNSNNTVIQPVCEKLNEGVAALNCSPLVDNEQAVDATPTTHGEDDPLQKKEMYHRLTGNIPSPAEGLTDHLETNYCQLNCDLSGSYPATDEIGVSRTFDNEGEKRDLSDTHVQGSEKSPVVQEPSDQQPCTESGSSVTDIASCGEQQYENQQSWEKSMPSKKRRNGPQRRILVEPFIPSEDPQQCRRTGKGWRCTVMASSGKRYCEKHDIEQNTRNVKRRKKPIETRAMEEFVPTDPQQCRRTGKGWRCHKLSSPGRRYCDKHQHEQDIHNEKRRKRRVEGICLLSNGGDETSISNDDHLISSDHMQLDIDAQCNQDDSRNVDEAHILETNDIDVSNESNEGDAGRTDPDDSAACIERTDWGHVMGLSKSVNIDGSTKGDQKEVDDTVSGEPNTCDAGKTDQEQTSQDGNTVRIDVANGPDTRKRKTGEFFDEFWSVFIT